MRRKPDGPANPALRAHVTRVGFDLTLGRTHIAKLVWINETLAAGDRFGTRRQDLSDPSYAKAFGNFVVGSEGLERRGLITYASPPNRYGVGGRETPPSEIWGITRAGELVIELLKETGLYQEYAAALIVKRAAS